MKLSLLIYAAILLAHSSHGAEVRITDKIIPLIQNGGGWQTKITITNLETTPAGFEIVFRNGSNGPLPVDITGPGVKMERGAIRSQLAPNASITLETSGLGEAVQTGHAFLYSLDNIKLGAKSVVRNAELKTSLTLPLSPEREDRLVLPFDNSDGAKTSFLWISETPYAMVDYVFLDPGGKELLKGSYQFTSKTLSTHELFLVEERFPELKGMRGILQMQASYPSAGFYDELLLTALALQADADGTTVVIPSMATNSWKSMRY